MPALRMKPRGSSDKPIRPAALLGFSCLAAVLVLALGAPSGFMVSFIPGSGSYVYPVMAPRLSSGYGMRVHPILRFSRTHQGIDLAAPLGSPVRAVADGVVVFADPYQGYGKLVLIKHARGMTSHYGHCDKIRVSPGQHVKAGEIVAYVGSSGMSTGPHLHFEIRFNGRAVDPERIIPGLASAAEG